MCNQELNGTDHHWLTSAECSPQTGFVRDKVNLVQSKNFILIAHPKCEITTYLWTTSNQKNYIVEQKHWCEIQTQMLVQQLWQVCDWLH